jgi:hypothetical protein
VNLKYGARQVKVSSLKFGINESSEILVIDLDHLVRSLKLRFFLGFGFSPDPSSTCGSGFLHSTCTNICQVANFFLLYTVVLLYRRSFGNFYFNRLDNPQN